MAHDNYPHDLDPLIRQLIRRKARLLTGRARLSPEDVEDLIQDFRVELLQKLPAFDPNKGSMGAFLKTLIDHFFANWLRHRFAAKRNPQRVVSLNMLVRNDEGLLIELGKAITHDVHSKRHGRRVRSDQEHADLQIDVEGVLHSLPRGFRDVADQLKDKSFTTAARELGMPRTTLHEWVRRLRQHCDRHDLRDFL
jgi:RNA polymerase sigma-70 factor (ECF subfamily)